MNKSLLALTIAASLALTGCGNDAKVDGKVQYEDYITNSLNADTKIVFDVLTDPILPTFLAMDTTDGTLSTEGAVGEEGYSTDLTDPVTALGKNDGWSTSQPIILPFDGLIDQTSAESAIYLYETKKPSPGKAAAVAKTLKNGDMLNLTLGDDYVVQVINDTKKKTSKIAIVPVKPLNAKSDYMFAITNALKDANGENIGMSPSYAMLKTAIKAPNESLVTGQQYTHGIEATFAAQGVDPESIIYSSWFTTATVGDVLYAAKSASALALQNDAKEVWKGSAVNSSVSEAELDSLFTMSNPTPTGNTTPLGNDIYTGTVKLPYFLDLNPATFATTPWQSGMPSLAKISAVLNDSEHKTYSAADQAAILGQLAALPEPITPEDLKNTAAGNNDAVVKVLTALTGSTLVLADGSQLDAERVITGYSPVPKLQSVQDVEYTLILPNKDECKKTAANTVSIFQHGITVSKDVLKKTTLADSIIGNQCHAVFAIDHPLHGTRGITLPGQGYVTASTKPELYLNLNALPVARDNLRQSTIDLVNLRLSLGRSLAALGTALKSQDSATISATATQLGNLSLLNPMNGVGFIGHSLGGISGVTLGHIANKPLNGEKETDLEKALFNINKLALANPGAGIPYLLLESESFGNFVKGSLVAATNKEFKANCDAKSLDYATCYGGYETQLIQAGDPKSIATLETVYSEFSKFAYAAQTILDPVDPINHSVLIDSLLPVYLAEVKGDKTIPNKLIPMAKVEGTNVIKPYSPFGGTEPLIKTMAVWPTASTIPNGATVRNTVLFNEGGHGSLLNPKESLDVTTEMQTQISQLLNNGGKGLTIDNSQNIIDEKIDPMF